MDSETERQQKLYSLVDRAHAIQSRIAETSVDLIALEMDAEKIGVESHLRDTIDSLDAADVEMTAVIEDFENACDRAASED